MNKQLFLVCNAHLDPVWLWQRNEGMAEALATFRIAADFCERYDGFVFNHNESVLYEWVLENDPGLFSKIQKLVSVGKWNIIGGWYLQPDVLMPGGESIISQIKYGQDFFKKHFNKTTSTAINFDSFGHTKGLVQILSKCGYKNYVYLRPRERECGPFVWQGFADTKVTAYKLYEWYNTPKGEASQRVISYLNDYKNRKQNLLTWGIGNHGGGPSEKDFCDIEALRSQYPNVDFIHGDFEEYFKSISNNALNVVDKSLVHCMVGCYTSMVRVKQAHRALENKLSLAKRLIFQSDVEYDAQTFDKAQKALLFSEFHDILPGSSIKQVENDSLRILSYGDEIVDRIISRAFFKMCQGQTKAKEGEIPVLIYNPHPYEVEGDYMVEFQLAEQNHPSNGIYNVRVRNDLGNYVPSQLEQEASAHGMDWRKRVAFHTTLKPMTITRLDCELELTKEFCELKPFEQTQSHIIISDAASTYYIGKSSGLIERIIRDGVDLLSSPITIKVFCDNEDPWGMEVDRFNECIGEFSVLSGDRAASFTGGYTIPVNVIENGEVHTVVESLLYYSNSILVMRYTFSKFANSPKIDIRLLSNDANVMYKLCVPTTLSAKAMPIGQTMFGVEELASDGREVVFQKWCGLSKENEFVGIINNGTYGGSINNGCIQLSLLRTPVYSAHPVEGVELAPKNRIYDRIDMGEREFSFELCFERELVEFASEKFAMAPYVLSFFPSGDGISPQKQIVLDNKQIILSAVAKDNTSTKIRLYNSAPSLQKTILTTDGYQYEINFKPYEVKTIGLSDGTQNDIPMISL